MKLENVPLIHRQDDIHRKHQILTVGGATLALFATGNILGFSSVTVPTLLKNAEINADSNDLTWIARSLISKLSQNLNLASLVTLGSVLGTFIGGLTSDAIGRKRTILLSSVIYTLGWIVIAQATEVADLLAGRMLSGIASGFYGVSVQVYISEIVESDLRGVSGSLPSLMVSMGILSIWFLGSVTNWRTVALASSFFPVIVFFYVLFLPESPVWLVSKGRHPDAVKTLTWLRSTPMAAEAEFLRLRYLKERRMSKNFSLRHCCARIVEPSFLKPLFISIALFFFQQFCGQYAIIFYATTIFQYADHFINDYLETIVLGLVRLCAILLAIFMVNFLTRKFLLVVSGLIMTFSSGALGFYFFYRSLEGDFVNSTITNPLIPHASEPFNIEWVPLASLLLFMTGYSLGFGIIPWFLVPEITPADVRSLSCSLAYALNQIFMFISVKTFIQTVEMLDASGTFWMFSAVAFAGVIFVIICVPETSNLDPVQIEDIFDDSSRPHNTHRRHLSFDESTF